MAEHIEREALLDRMNNFCEINCDYTKKQRSVMCGACGIGYAKIMVEDAVAEDVRPVVHGRWEKATGMMPPEYCGLHICSECGHYAGRKPPYGGKEFLSDYCPNCGADMRTDETED